MKISVQLEADSAEELQAFFAAFAAAPVPRPITETPITVRVPEQAPEVPLTAQEVVDITQAPVEPKRGRGRPRKEVVAPTPPAAVPVEPQPATPAPVEPQKPAAATQANGEVLTRQDLLDAFAEYVQRYGASFGYTDISKLLQSTLGDTVRKASDVPEAALPQAIGAIKAALNDNPFNRKRDYA